MGIGIHPLYRLGECGISIYRAGGIAPADQGRYFAGKTEETARKLPRHCEEPTGNAAISWWLVLAGINHQEIATPLRARNDGGGRGWPL